MIINLIINNDDHYHELCSGRKCKLEAARALSLKSPAKMVLSISEQNGVSVYALSPNGEE